MNNNPQQNIIETEIPVLIFDTISPNYPEWAKKYVYVSEDFFNQKPMAQNEKEIISEYPIFVP